MRTKSITSLRKAEPKQMKWGKDKDRSVHGSNKWKVLSRRYLDANPICVQCGAPSQETDHITPISKGGEKWKQSNWQALCKVCHTRKTNSERKL